jgi:hypothetical protein
MGQEASTSNIVSAKVWKTRNIFPDANDFPETELTDLLSKPNTALCFSGGGARSMISSIGFLAGLRNAGLLKKIRYGCLHNNVCVTHIFSTKIQLDCHLQALLPLTLLKILIVLYVLL